MDFSGVFMEMYGNVWKCMEMYGNVWKCMEMYGNVWKCDLNGI